MKRLVTCLVLLACDEVAAPPAPLSAVDTARTELPTFISFQAKVIARSCSPNPGVCHQTNNYPDLRTPGTMLGMVGMPCNLEIPDPTQGWDSCEAKPDRFEAEGFESDIAWREKVAGGWKLVLRDQAPFTATVTPALVDHAGEVLLYDDEELGVRARLVADSNQVILVAILIEGEEESFAEYLDAIMSTVVGGDPNQNGVWGFGDPDVVPGALIQPKSLERSYLWGRLTGTVPGTRMPLANRPLSDPEYIALACWIEGLDPEAASVEDEIDYDSCAFAQNPLSFATGVASAE